MMQVACESTELLERLQRMERVHARWQRGTLIAAGLLILAGLTGAAALNAPGVVEARSFVVVGEKGERLALLGPHPDGPGVSLILYDGGKGRAIVHADANDATFSLIENDQLRGALTARKGKHAGVLLQREKFDDRRNQMGFFYTDDLKPMLFINDDQGKSIVLLPQP
jgi:hypothetical protein